MVIDRAGKLRVVDNEHIRLDAIGYDLGRTWYRWMLPAEEWDFFYAAYAAKSPLAGPTESFHFWKISAAIASAHLRLLAYPEKAGVPIACLRLLAVEEVV